MLCVSNQDPITNSLSDKKKKKRHFQIQSVCRRQLKYGSNGTLTKFLSFLFTVVDLLLILLLFFCMCACQQIPYFVGTLDA